MDFKLSFLMRCSIFAYMIFTTLLIIYDHTDILSRVESKGAYLSESIDSNHEGNSIHIIQVPNYGVNATFNCETFLETHPFNLTRRVNLLFRPISLNVNHFIFLSTFRSGPKSFSVVGESSISEQKRLGFPVTFCIWESFMHNAPPIQTAATIHRAFNTHRKSFETMVIECAFEIEIGKDGQGGNLFIGSKKSKTKFLVHKELPGKFCIAHQKPKYETGLCGPPMFNKKINAVAIKKWFMYHEKVLKFGYYFLYDYDIGKEFQKILNNYLRMQKATIIRVDNSLDYNAWYHHQTTNNNDCLYRSRFFVKWIFYLDFDEYVYFPRGGLSLQNALIEAGNASYVSLGSILWNVDYCIARKYLYSDSKPALSVNSETNPSPGAYLGRILWRENTPSCAHVKYAKYYADELCLKDKGHRKFFADPIKTVVIGVHNPMKVLGLVVNFNASVGGIWPKIYHFHGILGNRRVCKYILNRPLTDPDMQVIKSSFYLDTSFRNLLNDINVE